MKLDDVPFVFETEVERISVFCFVFGQCRTYG